MKVVLVAVFVAATLGLAQVSVADSALPKDSPFSATPTAPAAAPTVPEPFQLRGVTVMPEATRVYIYAAATHQSRWIAVGTVADGIKVVNYDADQKQAVISVGGVLHTLVLHEWETAAMEAMTPEVKAREARLLTGDLLDIGLQQRQAYTNAQKTAGN